MKSRREIRAELAEAYARLGKTTDSFVREVLKADVRRIRELRKQMKLDQNVLSCGARQCFMVVTKAA
jgi:hypothetical protein